MDYNYNFSNAHSDPYFTLTSFNSDITNRHYITLTNQVCQIGLIRINIWPNSSTMNKNGIIITTLHRVSEDTTPSSLTINNLTNKQLHILLTKTNL